MPARPRQRRITIGIQRLAVGAALQEELNHRVIAIGCGAVQRRLGPGADIAHEGTALASGDRARIDVRAVGEQQPQDENVVRPASLREGAMQRRLARVPHRMVDVGAVLDEEVAHLPVAEEGRVSEIFVHDQATEVAAGLQHRFQHRDVVVVNKPLHRLGASIPHGAAPVRQAQEIEDEVGAATADEVEKLLLGHGA